MKKKFFSLFWLIPFAAFVCGYFATRLLFSVSNVPVPRLVGLSLETGIKRASDNQLSVQIIAEKIDPDLQPGTIISQKPLEHQIARQHQVIYIVTAKRPETKKTPALCGKSSEEATQELTKMGISCKIITLPLASFSTAIIAQWPAAQEPLIEPIKLYTAQQQELFIIPDLSARPLPEVLSFLEKNNIPAQVTYRESAESYQVEQQRPLAGTIISLANPPTLQLLAVARYN